MVKSFYFFVLVAFLASCNGQKKMAEDQHTQYDEKMILVDQNNYSGADSTETLIITEAKALKSFYAQANRTRKPGLPVPEIDFSKHVAIIHCSSDENFTGSDKISVVQETDTELVVGMSGANKNDKDISAADPKFTVSPFFVYIMPLTDKKISVKKIE